MLEVSIVCYEGLEGNWRPSRVAGAPRVAGSENILVWPT